MRYSTFSASLASATGHLLIAALGCPLKQILRFSDIPFYEAAFYEAGQLLTMLSAGSLTGPCHRLQTLSVHE